MLERAPKLVQEILEGLPPSATLLEVVPGSMGWSFTLKLSDVAFRVVYDRGFVETYEHHEGPDQSDQSIAVTEGEDARAVIDAIAARVSKRRE